MFRSTVSIARFALPMLDSARSIIILTANERVCLSCRLPTTPVASNEKGVLVDPSGGGVGYYMRPGIGYYGGGVSASF
jgi:hypothetical protein